MEKRGGEGRTEWVCLGGWWCYVEFILGMVGGWKVVEAEGCPVKNSISEKLVMSHSGD